MIKFPRHILPALAVVMLVYSLGVPAPALAQFSQEGGKLVGSGAVGRADQGQSVAISADGNTAVVGGYTDSSNAGAAWVFTRSGSVWTQQGVKLVGTGAAGGAGQGFSVALSDDGNTAIVGGPGDNSAAGTAWVFTRSGSMWSQQGGKLVGAGAVAGEIGQGYSVALSADGNTAILGGPADSSGAGAAWVFAQPLFAGSPGQANCKGKSVSALAQQYGGLPAAAAALGYSSVPVLQNAITVYCAG